MKDQLTLYFRYFVAYLWNRCQPLKSGYIGMFSEYPRRITLQTQKDWVESANKNITFMTKKRKWFFFIDICSAASILLFGYFLHIFTRFMDIRIVCSSSYEKSEVSDEICTMNYTIFGLALYKKLPVGGGRLQQMILSERWLVVGVQVEGDTLGWRTYECDYRICKKYPNIFKLIVQVCGNKIIYPYS